MNELARRIAASHALRAAAQWASPHARSALGWVFAAFGWLVLAVAWLWALGALWYFEPWPPLLGAVAALLWLAWTAWSFRQWSRRRAVAGLAGGIVLIWTMTRLHRPANDRDWALDQRHSVQVTWNEPFVTLQNVRRATPDADGNVVFSWTTRTYRLDELESVDFVMSPFSRWGTLAHVFLTFGFRNGEHLAVSIEARRQRGETYSPLRGLFRCYELIYVVGDESDLIGLRANVRHEPVYVYPVKADDRQIRQLFISMLTRADRLQGEPEFYQTFANDCCSNLLAHVNAVRQSPIGADWRLLLTGFSDELAFKLGLLKTDGDLAAMRSRCCITGRTEPWSNDAQWSRQIRGEPAMPRK